MFLYANEAPAKVTRSRQPCAVSATPPWEGAPRWGWLYTALLVIAGLGLTAEVLASTPGWRRLVEIVTGAGVLGSMAMWLGLNRVRLACQEPGPKVPRPGRVIGSPASPSLDRPSLTRLSGR